ncbi:MAG: hypothetical protein AB1422_13030 [bacterium]
MKYPDNEKGEVILLLVVFISVVLFMLVFSFYLLSKVGYSNAVLEEGYCVALPLAEAGAERAMWHLTQTPSWRAGYGNPHGAGEPFYYPNSTYEIGQYWVTLSTVLQTVDYSIVRITSRAQVKGPKLFGVGVGFGATKMIEEVVKVVFTVKPVGARYAIMTGGKLNLNANSIIYGSIRANDTIQIDAKTDIYPDPFYREGRVLTSKNIGVKANLFLHDTSNDLQDVRAKGTITDKSKISGTADGIFEYDTTSDTDGLINDGSIKPGESGTYIPNPNMNEIMAAVTQVHTETKLQNFDLAGGVHLFLNGIEFTPGKISGKGTIIVINNKDVVFSTPVGKEGEPVEMNIIVISGTDGVIGTGDIYFNQSSHLKGLIYCHDSIYAQANFSVTGSVISYDGELILPKAQSEYTLNPFMPVTPPGFSNWWDPTGNVVGSGGSPVTVLSWRELL